MANRLAAESSPYLTSHSTDLIDWWPWGPEALDSARERQLPVLLSVGYASCHWCHVMAAESFNDAELAAFINENFVAIAVDREERPDVDQVFMDATQALTGQGGWPMTVFCTPEAKPFFAGTYFPAEPRDGQPSFSQLCHAMADAWQQRRDEVLESGVQIAAQLSQQAAVGATQPVPRPATDELLAGALELIDPENGGFGSAPKFPQTPVLDALMVSGEPHQIEAVQGTLEHIVRGGIHDVVGGGFHRYATDAAWNVPHFEKMLDDNALLLGTLTRAWRRTGPETGDLRDHFELAIRGIVGWLTREMAIRCEAGTAYASGQDADSPDDNAPESDSKHVEGAFYLWTPAQVEAIFNRKDALFAQAVFHLTPKGTMADHTSTLRLHGDPDPDRLKRILGDLRQARDKRPAPLRDDKVIADANGLLAQSLTEAAMVFGEPEWLAMARGIIDYLWVVHGFDSDNPRRISRDGKAGDVPAQLSDHAGFVLAAGRLAGATGDRELLDRAVKVLTAAVQGFGTVDGGFDDAPPDESLFARAHQLADQGGPSATSIMVNALHLVAGLTGDSRWSDRAARAEIGLWAMLAQSPLASGWGLANLAIDAQADAGMARAQVAVTDPSMDPMGMFVRAVWRLAPEGTVIVLGKPNGEGFGGQLAVRPGVDDKPTAYICRDETCFDPVTDFGKLRDPLWRRVVRASLPADGERKARPAKVTGVFPLPGPNGLSLPQTGAQPGLAGAAPSEPAKDKPPFAWQGLKSAEFGFPGELRDILLSALLAGNKTSTSSLLVEYEREGRDPLAERGSYEVVVDSDGEPVAIMRIARVDVLPYGLVDASYAESEGFPSLAEWHEAHEALWTSPEFLATLGDPPVVLDADTQVVLTRFRAYRPGDIMAGHVVDFDS